MISVWPSIIWIGIVFFGLSSSLIKGKDIGLSIFAHAMGISILWWGGFFDVLIAKLG